jgi:hypothetical protein
MKVFDPVTNLGSVEEEKKSLLPLPGIECRFLGRPAHFQVSIPSELSRLLVLAINEHKGRPGMQNSKRISEKHVPRFYSFILKCV